MSFSLHLIVFSGFMVVAITIRYRIFRDIHRTVVGLRIVKVCALSG